MPDPSQESKQTRVVDEATSPQNVVDEATSPKNVVDEATSPKNRTAPSHQSTLDVLHVSKREPCLKKESVHFSFCGKDS